MIEFKETTIAPAGRNKYGHYVSNTNITKSVKSTVYAGNDTTTSIGGNGGNEDTGTTNFYAMLSQTNVTFDAIDLTTGATAATQVIAYQGYNKAVTLICDINAVSATVANGGIETLEVPVDSGMTGIPSGMSATCVNNGTSSSTIYFTADSTLAGNTGSIMIPVTVYKRSDDLPIADLYNWYDHAYQLSGDTIIPTNNCEVVWLEFVWNVNRGASSNYVMDLTNQTANVNCDENGNMFSASIMTITCSAKTTMNGEDVEGVEYSLGPLRFNGRGVSINQTTGVLTFNYSGSGAYFAFDADALPIDIIATISEGKQLTKTMTIYKNFPGADGSPATSHWINTSVNAIKYNPNNNTYTPSAVTAECWKQVGYEEPVIDSATTMWSWYSTTPSGSESRYTAGTPVRAVAGQDYIAFGIKNSDGKFYETEEVPILAEGLSGGTGPQGPQGPSGATGDSGQSSWYLSLDNSNCSINADADGTILSGAVHPSCVARVYYGSQRMTAGFTWDIDADAVGDGMILTDWDTPSVGCITLRTTPSLQFSGESIGILIGIKVSGETVDTKYWSICKSIGGADGTPAETHWLAVNATEVTYDPNYPTGPTPGSVSAVSYVQIGDGAPFISSADTRIEWTRVKRSGGSIETYKDYTMGSLLNISTNSANTYSTIKFRLMKGQAQLDQQDIALLKNGLNGEKGADGRQGAAIRGPYDYYAVSASNQCWCAGSSGVGVCQECEKWIDVVLKDNKYYYCATSYTGTLTSHFPSYWVEGDSFDFVATRVLLASAASINFLSNNELYLRDQNGNITGGAKGGSGTTFWAGAEEPFDAPFRVDVSGNVFAQKGVFAGYIQYPYINLGGLDRDTDDAYLADGRANLIADKYLESYYYSGYAASQSAHLKLPEPSSGLNGFTYHIVIYPDYLTRTSSRSAEQRAILSVVTKNFSQKFYVAAFASDNVISSTIYKRLEFFAGHIEITCMPRGIPDGNDWIVEYLWVVTNCTGGLSVYDNTDLYELSGAYGPIMGYSPTDNYNVPVRLQTDSNPSSSQRERNTIYVTL